MNIGEEKRALRAKLREKLSLLDKRYISLSDAGILSAALEFLREKPSRRVFCYFSVGREADTRRLIAELLSMGKTVALPLTYPGGLMDFMRVSDLDSLERGLLGIPSPAADSEKLEPEKTDVLIVPALAFDLEGYRIGQGGGYYDRYIDRRRCLSVGLCRDKMLEERIPREKHDRRVDILLTETGIKKSGGSG